MGDKRRGDYVNLGALYGAARPENAGIPRPDPMRGPVFVTHGLQLRRDLEIINACIVAELGPLPSGGLPVQPKRKSEVMDRPLPATTDHETMEDGTMKLNQIVATAAITAGIAACEPSSEIEKDQPISKETPTITRASVAIPHGSSTACANTIFHCKTKNNKEVSVCDLGETLNYSFGRPGAAPEISISVQREAATTSQWKGVGRWIYYSVSIPRGNTSYSVFTSLDRASDSHEFEAGISVIVGDDEVARIACDQLITNRLEGIDLKEE